MLWLVAGCEDDAAAERAAKPLPAAAKDAPPVAPAAVQEETPPEETPPKAEPAAARSKPDSPGPTELTQQTLDSFVPAQLEGLERAGPPPDIGVTEGPLIAHGAYRIQEDGDARLVNVNLIEVVDLEFERAQFKAENGESLEGGAITGQEIDGRLVQRRAYGTPPKSEVIVLLADRIVVRVSVEKAEDPDEALRYLAALDLAGLEALVQ